MRSKKLISAVAALSMVVSSFAGIVTANAEDTETVYNFSELTEESYSKSGASVFDGALTLSGTDSIKPKTVNTAVTTPLGSIENVTSALITKQLAVKINLDAGETVVEYYCGSDSGATKGQSIDVVVKDSSGTVVATETNAENSGVKPYVIYYTAETAGEYTIVDSGTSTYRTIVYAVATTTGTYTPPAADATAPAATVDPNATPAPTPTPRPTVDPNGVADITITNSVGWLETAYVTWTNPTPVDYYNVYVKPEGGEYTKIDDELVRNYGSYYRADALGLKAGSYRLKVEPIIGGAAQEAKETDVLEVKAHVREGFAFDPTSPHYNPDGVGGYKNDGTVKDGAKIIYITDANKDTIQFDVVTNTSSGTVTSCTGLGEILTAREKNSAETTPLIIRMIGQVSSPAGKDSSGFINIKATSNVTFEGVGEDAATNGWSFLLRTAENVEVRNVAIMGFHEDGVSLDTKNYNCWIHNCDIFYGENQGGDKVKGDGSLDVKSGSDYCTFSYNHFWDSGKASLCGMTSDSYMGYHMTYHHNWFDHSDSRHPRVRGDQVHVYNNYYDGNSKYGVGACTGSSVYVEKNVFRNCLHPVLISKQGTDALGAGTFSGEDGGSIKMYDNAVYGGYEIIYASETNTNDFDAYLATTREETVPSTYSAKQGGSTYSNFDTAADMYSYNPTDTEDVVENVQTYAGRVEGGDFTYEFDDAVDDASYARNADLDSVLTSYVTSLKIEYATGEEYPGTGGELPTARPTAEPFDPDVQPTAKPSDGTGGSDTNENTVIWRASDTGADAAAGTVLKEDWLTLAGAELAYSSTNKTIGGVSLTGKMAGLSANPKPALENPEAGAALKFTPSEDGTIKVYFKLNTGKIFYITDASGNVIASHENTSSESEYTTLSADVTAGTVYYAFGDGTNAEFWAAEYTSDGSYSDGAEDDPTDDPDDPATPDPGTTTPPDTTTPPAATTPPAETTEPSDLNAVTTAKEWTFTRDGLAAYGTAGTDDKGNEIVTISSTVIADDMKIGATDAKTIVIDDSNKSFENTDYTSRLKFGGTGSTTERYISFLPGKNGTVKVYALSGSTGAERTLNVVQGSNTAAVTVNSTVADTYDEISVTAGTPVYIYSASSGINVYSVIYTPEGSGSGDEETPTPDATQAPSGEKCIKLVAEYNEDDTLNSVTITEVPVEEAAAASTEGNTKTMYWDSLAGMKPVAAQTAPDDDATNPPSVSDEPVNAVTPETTVTVGSGVKLSADDLEQAEYKETIAINNFYIGADESADENGKATGSVTVDSAGTSGATVNGTKYYNRIKTGGAGNPETGVRCFYFTVDSDCTMVMDATASSSGVTRDIVVLHGDTVSHLAVDEKAGYTLSGIKAGETVVIYSTEGGLNVYGIALTPASADGEDEGGAPVQAELTAQNEAVKWTFTQDAYSLYGSADASTGALTLTSPVVLNNIKVTAGSSTNVVIDSSNKTFDEKYTSRLKLSGTGSSTKRCISFIPGKDGTVNVYAVSGSSSAERTLVVEQGGETKGSFTVGSDPTIGTAVPVTANEPVYIYSSADGINVYAVVYTPTE